MKNILIIGIGAGNPDYLTLQAVHALAQVDVFFLMDKGAAKSKLIALRTQIIERFARAGRHRVVEATSPERGADNGDYRAAVDQLNHDKQAIFEQLIAHEMADGECGAFLVWGDPALYDSTIRIISAISQSGRQALEYDVIPGISSVQALAARHRIPLNLIGRSIEITNGRTIAAGFPAGIDSVVVMLDSQDSYLKLVDADLDIYWGAYLGTPDEILIAGRLAEVGAEIARVRAAARDTHGWIMDTYLLRKPDRRAADAAI
ncbi:MAG: precorrin-6A synthase (deacetylating) [Janthinobacterium lividum]